MQLQNACLTHEIAKLARGLLSGRILESRFVLQFYLYNLSYANLQAEGGVAVGAGGKGEEAQGVAEGAPRHHWMRHITQKQTSVNLNGGIYSGSSIKLPEGPLCVCT